MCNFSFQVQSEIKKKWHRFCLTRFDHLPNSRKNSQNLTVATYLSRTRESNASVTQIQESREYHGNGTVRGINVNSINDDSSTNLFPMKARKSLKMAGNSTISETDETEPMIRQFTFIAAEGQNHADIY